MSADVLKGRNRIGEVVVMAEKKQKNKKITLPAVAVFLVTAFLLIKGVMQQPKITANKEEIESLNIQIAQQQKKLDELEELKTKVDSEEYIEKVAREKLGLIKENEIMFIDVAGE